MDKLCWRLDPSPVSVAGYLELNPVLIIVYADSYFVNLMNSSVSHKRHVEESSLAIKKPWLIPV